LKRRIRIGIPRALSYYTFYPLWRVFLEKLGAEIIVSKNTNRKILEDGIKETVNDACVPIKVFHGGIDANEGIKAAFEKTLDLKVTVPDHLLQAKNFY